MKGVILDADSLGHGVDLSPVTELLDHWDIHASTVSSEVSRRIDGASVVLSNKVPLNEAVFAATPSLKLVSIMATGTNNVDLLAAGKLGVTVCNAVAYATPSVVQHTIALMLNLATNLTGYVDDVRNGHWQKSPVFCLLGHPIIELAGKTLGIVGYGELGSNLAKVATAFGMHVIISETPSTKEGRVPLEELLKSSDFVSLHCPLTDSNQHMINRETLALMKQDAFLINTARGGLVNSKHLIQALGNNIIRGAAIDVLDAEPPSADEPLIAADLPNLLITPHNAWGAIESRQRLIVQMQENITGFLKGTIVRQVN